jgi:hypothetical protein
MIESVLSQFGPHPFRCRNTNDFKDCVRRACGVNPMMKVDCVYLVNQIVFGRTGIRLERGHTFEMACIGALSPHFLRCHMIDGRIDHPDRPSSRQSVKTFAVLFIDNDKYAVSSTHSRKEYIRSRSLCENCGDSPRPKADSALPNDQRLTTSQQSQIAIPKSQLP